MCQIKFVMLMSVCIPHRHLSGQWHSLVFLYLDIVLIVDGSSLALSIRDFDSRTNDYTVKHYKIRKMDNGNYFIAVKRTFPNIVALVKHYKGMSTNTELSSRQWWRVDNSTIPHERTTPYVTISCLLDFGDGLCCKLGLSCPKSRPIVAFRELEINRSGIKLIRKLGAGHFGEVWAG